MTAWKPRRKRIVGKPLKRWHKTITGHRMIKMVN
jgi:hypothetical protein